MKILFIASTLKRTGPVNIMYNLIKYLDKSIYKPVILTLSKEEGESRINDFKELGIEIYQLNLTRTSGFTFGRRKLKQFIKKINPDIIHNCGFRADYIISKYSKDFKVVSTLQNYPYYDYTMTYGNIIGWIMAKLHTNSFFKFNQVFTCSKAVEKLIYKKNGYKLKVIHNGIDTELFYPISISEKLEAKKDLGIPINIPTFIFIGNLTERKDPLTTINAFKKAYKEEDAFLIIIGAGDIEEKCRKETEKNNNIKFVGVVSDTFKYIKASEYYVASSLAEGFPTAVMEALAVGLPVILSDIEPHIEMLSLNEEAGIFFRTKDVDDLINSFTEILNKDYKVMSNAALELIEVNLSARVMAKMYQKEYDNIFKVK